MKKYRLLRELNQDELKRVFENNNKLQVEVIEDIEESEMFWISEYLDPIKKSLSDWSIGFHNHNYIKIKDTRLFLEGLELIQESFELLRGSLTEEIKKVIEKLNVLYDMDYNNRNYHNLEDWIDNKVECLANELVKSFNSLTDYNSGDIESYFLDFYVEERMHKDFYIDRDFILYQDVAYTKSYS